MEDAIVIETGVVVRARMTILVAAIIIALFTSDNTWSQDRRPTEPKQAGSPVRRPREPEWLPVRELLAESLLIEFAVDDSAGQPPGAVKTKVRRQQVVCLRGIVPRQEQVRRLTEALKIDKPDEALEFVDFKIERQVASGKPASWDKIPWEALSTDDLIELLSSAAEFDPDEIQPAEQSPALTSPLPHLVQGEWDERVSHPRLKDNKLPAQGANATDAPTEHMTARYVLFRFFDVNVEPGRSYRYRVKLVFENPSYGEERVPNEVAEGEFRESPFSDPSAPVVVEKPSK